jgi:hypothetical protein
MALYVFGIGGTGARVIKALTMLLASGVRVPNANAIVPILIDPDNANGDLTRTLELLRLYRDIRLHTEQDVNGFFYNELKSLSDVDGVNTSNAFHFQLSGVGNNRFKELIELSSMNRASQSMTRMLFSDTNLNADMQVGFKGNPNIGSVVLNKFKDAPVFQAFANAFNPDDRIVIIGSIFGGTGAAGLPLLIKNLRDANPSLPKHQLLRDAPIAAISVLPYFDVQGDEGISIDSNTFVSKTKAALTYYAENLCKNNSLNALYYLGDVVSNTQKGADGAAAQRNRAHFIELAAAMAIVNFMGYDKNSLAVTNGRAQDPMYFEYGLKQPTNEIHFEHLGPEMHSSAGKSLTQYFLFQKFFREYYKDMPEHTGWMKNGINKLDLKALDQRLVSDLNRFNDYFEEWLKEMEESTTSFKPFRRDVGDKDILNAVTGFEDQPGFLEKMKGLKGLHAFSYKLSKAEPGMKPLGSSDRKLFGLFYTTTKDLVENRIKL